MSLATLGTDLENLAEIWTTDGLRTAIDPRDINPPCVWLVPTEFEYPTLDGEAVTAKINAICVTGDYGTSKVVLDELGTLVDELAKRTKIIGTIPAVTATLPGINPDPLIALQVPIELMLTK